tara:strand:+ start:140379 stop:140927 length:549 start_codon:yes stop_codon:yes gene_type:complete
MAEFGSTENILWFWAVLIITVAPVLRFRENMMVPMLGALMAFGFYTQAYWMPDFYALADWPRIIGTVAAILGFYFVCGFIVHFLWFRAKSARLKAFGAFGPLLSAWIKGKAYVVNDEFVAEIRRLRMFEVAWKDVSRFQDGEELILSDDVEREPEILSEVRITPDDEHYEHIKSILERIGKL